MAEFRIAVRIDPQTRSGVRVVERDLNRIGMTADRTRQLISRALAFTGLAVGIRQLGGLVDTYTNIQNRLRVVTDGTEELAQVTDRLFSISNNTRSSFETTARVYAQVGLAAQESGRSQAELLDFTESLNQAVILSGASAAGASAGLLQLSQGIASGTLRGEELNSVLEQIPVVADVIAQSLGATRGELRALGAAGQITGDQVLDAFREAREELAERFGETVSTIGQSFVILRNNLTRVVGSFADTSGIASALSGVITVVANNVDTLVRSVSALAIALALLSGPTALVAATRSMIAFNAAILANPLVTLTVLIAATIGLLISFSDQISVGGDRLATLRDLGVATFEALGNGLTRFSNFIRPVFDLLSTISESVLGDIETSLEGILTLIARALDGFVNLARRTAIILSSPFAGNVGQNLVAILAEDLRDTGDYEAALNALFDRADSIAETRIARLAGLRGLSGADTIIPNPNGDNVPPNGSAEVIDNITDRNAILQRQLDLLDEEARLLRVVSNEREVLTAQLTLEEQIRTTLRDGDRGLSEEQINNLSVLTDQEENLLRQLILRNSALNTQSDILDEIRGPELELMQRQEAIEELYNSGTISIGEYEEALRSLNVEVTALDNTLAGGLENGLARIEAQTDELGQRVSDNLVSTFESITGPSRELELTQQSLQTLFDEGRITLEQYSESLRDLEVSVTSLDNSLSGGLENGLARIEAQANDFGQRVSDNLVSTFESITGPARELELTQQSLQTLFDEGRITLEQYSEGLRDLEVDITALDNSLEGGIANGLAILAQQSEDVGSRISSALVGAYNTIRGPQEELMDRQEGLTALFEDGRISIEEYNEAIRNLGQELSALDNSFSGGIENGLQRIQNRVDDLGTSVSDIVVGAFDMATNSIVNFARTGEFSVREFFGSIFEQLLRLATNQLFSQLLGGSGSGLQGILGNLFQALPGFQNGGQFTVRGSGGSDSQLVAFRATPGERVAIETPNQQRQNSSSPVTINPQAVNIINVTDPSQIPLAMDSAEGEEVIINTIKNNPREIRRLIGA